MIGTSVALNRRIDGGVVPGGNRPTSVCDVAVSWATPRGTSASGWKYTLMTATPFIDCDSMCSTSCTVAENARSQSSTMRRSISSGGSPLYDQITVTTGRLIDGKMSTA